MNLGINRRKFPRMRLKCRSSINCTQGIKVIDAVTENISTGGICVIFNEDVGLFNEAAIELFLEGVEIQCEGIVVWIIKKQDKALNVYETGIEFSRIDQADKKLIQGKIENLLKGNSFS